MMNKTKVRVEFMITGLILDPDELTKLLKIKPSRTWRIGDVISNTTSKWKYNCWALLSIEKDIDIEIQIIYLLDLLNPKNQLINSLCQKYNLECTFACGIDVYKKFYPPLHLTADTIYRMSLIGAEIDIDII